MAKFEMGKVEFDEGRVDALFAALDQCRFPGVTVGIALRGRPLYRKGFGLANMELPVPLAPTTRLRIASGTKHFTSLAYLLLCEEGKADLDSPVQQFLPELNRVTRGVTMRQLMGHVSGLHDSHDIAWLFSGRQTRVTSNELLSLYRDIDSVNVPPNSTWLYNNGGYLLLTAVIERITGQSLEQVLKERLFERIGMNDTLLRRFDHDLVFNSASLHRSKAQPAYESTTAKVDTREGAFEKFLTSTAWAGEGGLVSTVDDMLRWLAHMDRPVVGSSRTWDALLAPLTLANGTSTHYALGLMRGRYRGVETIHHAGGVTGGNAHLLKVPIAGLDLVVMANRDDVISVLLVNEILDACMPNLAPVQAPARRAFAEGTFCSHSRQRVIQLFVKDKQQMAAINGLDLPVAMDDEGLLRPAGIFNYLQQSIKLLGSDPSQPAGLEFRDFGNLDQLVRVHSERHCAAVEIMGRYRSDTIDTEAEITAAEAEGPVFTTFGRFGTARFQLEALGDGIWRARSLDPATAWAGGLLFFDAAQGFQFSGSRTWAIPFAAVDKGL